MGVSLSKLCASYPFETVHFKSRFCVKDRTYFWKQITFSDWSLGRYHFFTQAPVTAYNKFLSLQQTARGRRGNHTTLWKCFQVMIDWFFKWLTIKWSAFKWLKGKVKPSEKTDSVPLVGWKSSAFIPPVRMWTCSEDHKSQPNSVL